MSNSYTTLLRSLEVTQHRLTDRPRKKRRLVEEDATLPTSKTFRRQEEVESGKDARSDGTASVHSSSDEKPIAETIDSEAEEADTGSTSDDASEEDDSALTKSDPFETHLNRENSYLKKLVSEASQRQWHRTRGQRDALGRVERFHLGSVSDAKAPIEPMGKSLHDLRLIKRLQDSMASKEPKLSKLENLMAPVVFGYQDLLFCRRTAENSGQIRRATCLHVLNHIYKTRRRILKNNARQTADQAGAIVFQDQGFTRPKVLIVLPTREACTRWVETLKTLSGAETQENKSRFLKSFHNSEDEVLKGRTPDFLELFGGNNDDNFKIGLKFTRKTMKLFAPFYSSDIIIASPLGLRMAMGDENSKSMDYDFLSSIEILLIDHAVALMMQNWEHVQQIVEHTGLQPREPHGCDFSRVREWYLDGHARFLRQTLVFSSFLTPELNALFTQKMQNIDGKTKITAASEDGTMLDLEAGRQSFIRLVNSSAQDSAEQRFKHFTTMMLPALLRGLNADTSRRGALLFIPSYFEFVRIRNYLQSLSTKQDFQFGSISEYTSLKETTRARSHFFYGRYSLLLYTERAHHFHRYVIRGVKTVSMYGLPHNPVFYREIAGGYLAKSIEEGIISTAEAHVDCLFDRWDALKLERIVGSDRIGALLKDKGDTFEFV